MVLGVVFSLLGIGMLVALMFNMAILALPLFALSLPVDLPTTPARACWAQSPSALWPALPHSASDRLSW